MQAIVRLCLLSFLTTSCLATSDRPAPFDRPARSHLSYAPGLKWKSSEWAPAERETLAIAADLDWRPNGWPVWLVAQLLVGSAEREPEFATHPHADSSGTFELGLGVRRYGSFWEAEPFLGAGLAYLAGEVGAFDSGDAWELDEGGALGWWVDAGLRYSVWNPFQIGLAFRYSTASEFDLLGTDVDAGGTSVLVLLGVRR